MAKTRRDVLTTKQAATVLRVSNRTVTKWFDTGLLPGFRLPNSGDRRFELTGLQAFIRDNNMPMEWLTSWENGQC